MFKRRPHRINCPNCEGGFCPNCGEQCDWCEAKGYLDPGDENYEDAIEERPTKEGSYVTLFTDGLRSSLRWPTIGYSFAVGVVLGLVLLVFD